MVHSAVFSVYEQINGGGEGRSRGVSFNGSAQPRHPRGYEEIAFLPSRNKGGERTKGKGRGEASSRIGSGTLHLWLRRELSARDSARKHLGSSAILVLRGFCFFGPERTTSGFLKLVTRAARDGRKASGLGERERNDSLLQVKQVFAPWRYSQCVAASGKHRVERSTSLSLGVK